MIVLDVQILSYVYLWKSLLLLSDTGRNNHKLNPQIVTKFFYYFFVGQQDINFKLFHALIRFTLENITLLIIKFISLYFSETNRPDGACP